MAHKKEQVSHSTEAIAEVTKESLDFAASVGKRTLVDDVVADFGHCVVRRRNNRMFKQEDVDRMLKECREDFAFNIFQDLETLSLSCLP